MTSALNDELLTQCSKALALLGSLEVKQALLVDPKPSPDRDAEFGLITLSNDFSGLYYAWLGEEQAELPKRFTADALEGQPVQQLLTLYSSDDNAARSLAMAAINAITAALYAAARFVPAVPSDSFAGIKLIPGTVLGMIGYFPPLVRRALEHGMQVRVLEKKAHMVQNTHGLVVSLEADVLNEAEQLIITGTALINQTMQALLTAFAHSRHTVILGPTVGCFPDALFARGADVVAGTLVTPGETAYHTLSAGGRLKSVSQRYCLARNDYPGFPELLNRAVAA